ncbi:DUF1345 domain-containing protein [Deinococcus sp. KNUC1210]|uniref:DUF1345 domain-containing protein n=1 Tax=Deinococcus sp. KNUC1210 TaxID=2917691 RepID=UPI001EF03219|nr:DUF1345 domain-containing protein [Deinococcus sp. KNUC1210]ULH15474.1 DUF1345 domain-containing protein [Deinococcus sp. KNUC1210]
MNFRLTETPAVIRLALSAGLGLLASVLIPRPDHLHWEYHALVGWCVAAAVFLLISARVIFRSDGKRTREVATREDDSRAATSLIVLLGSGVSLAGVVYAMSQASDLQKQNHVAAAAILTGLGVGVVVLSWLLIQTVYTFRYAHLYYASPEGGIQFDHDDDIDEDDEGNEDEKDDENETDDAGNEPPDYQDFWYLAVTIGMTFQVSDTNLSRKTIRRALTNHALISYAYNAVLVAFTINIVASFIS